MKVKMRILNSAKFDPHSFVSNTHAYVLKYCVRFLIELWRQGHTATCYSCGHFTFRVHAVAHLVEAVRYKSEGRGLDSDGVTGIFHWHDSGINSATNRNEYNLIFLGERGRQVHTVDNLNSFVCRLSWNLRAWTSWPPWDPSRPIQGLYYLFTLLPLRSVRWNFQDKLRNNPD
jgi:hypothetical protein